MPKRLHNWHLHIKGNTLCITWAVPTNSGAVSVASSSSSSPVITTRGYGAESGKRSQKFLNEYEVHRDVVCSDAKFEDGILSVKIGDDWHDAEWSHRAQNQRYARNKTEDDLLDLLRIARLRRMI